MKTLKFNTFVVSLFLIAIITGFSVMDNEPRLTKSNPSNIITYDNSGTPNQIYGTPYYIDNFEGANDTTALKSRGYKVYYRGTGPQGIGATWFQGNSGVFQAFNGPTSGYVGANYQVATGTNNIDSWLVLPNKNVSAGDSIHFYSRAPLGSTFPDSIRVMYSAAGDSIPEAGSWVELGRFKVNTDGTWQKKGYGATSSGANARFAIRYIVANGGPTGANSDYIGIDALTLETNSLANDVGLNGNFIYSTISEAYNSIPNPVTSPQLIELKSSYNGSGETFPITLTHKSGTDSLRTITIRPAIGNNVTIQKNYNGPVIFLNGAKYLNIDGRPGGLDTLRCLSITNNNTDSSVSSIKAGNGIGYIKMEYLNCNVSGGINLDLHGPDSSVAISDTMGYVNINNNIFTGGNIGVSSEYIMPKIDYNYFFNCKVVGIYQKNNRTRDCTRNNLWNPGSIKENVITMNIPENEEIDNINIYGILLYRSAGNLYYNKIYGLKSLATGDRAITGIEINASCCNIYNNFVDLSDENFSSVYVYGISSINSNASIYHNTVRIRGELQNQTIAGVNNIASAGIKVYLLNGQGINNVGNNIVFNDRFGGNNTAEHVAEYLEGTGTASITSNFNMYYSAIGNILRNHININGVNYSDKAIYNADYPNNKHTLFVKPYFQPFNDLHLDYSKVNGNYWCKTVNGLLYSNFSLNPIHDDIDFEDRGNFPYKGADENALAYFKKENIPVDFEGNGGGASGKRDSVEVSLAVPSSPFSIVQSAKTVIDSGTNRIELAFPSNTIQNGVPYYIIVKSLNTLETWSAVPVAFNGDSLFYDFTSATSQAYGNNMKLIDGKSKIYSGDVNQDGLIDLSDVLQINNDANGFTTGITDLNGDGTTDLTDIIIAFNNSISFVRVKSPLNP